jgi:hypothetical protein
MISTRMSVPATIPVSAPARVRDLIRSAPDGPVSVVHAGPHAIYLAVGDRCVGLLARDAAKVPCGLRSRTDVFAGWSPVSAHVAAGTLYVDRIPLSPGRTVAVHVPSIGPGAIPRRAASPVTVAATPQAVVAGLVSQGVAEATAPPSLAVVAGLVSQGVAEATAPPSLAVVAGLVSQGVAEATAPPSLAVVAGLVPQGMERVAPSTVEQLLGRGDGLTPLGDDVLCGWIATHRAAGVPTPEVDDAVRSGLHRTTLLSATLLDCALHGECLPELGRFLRAVGTSAEPDRASELQAVGGTSGAGLLHGARLALDELAGAGSRVGAA